MIRLRAALGLALVALGPGAVLAGNAPADAPTDAELLEFLGSIDSGGDGQSANDGSWIDYLARTDINKVARTGDPEHAKPPPPSPPRPPASGDQNER